MSDVSLKELGWNGFYDKVWSRARRDCLPISGTFELTPLCNFRCRMCYMRLDPDKMAERGSLRTSDDWLDLARQAMDEGTIRITLTGGEVLTRQDFEEIYRKLIEMGLIVSVLSNGSLVNENIVRLFQAYKPSKLRFTLYGASNETYERLCQVPDGFERVISSLQMLNNGNVPFSLAFTKTKENASDLDSVLRIAERFETSVAITSTLVSAVRGAQSDSKDLRVPPTDWPQPRQTSHSTNNAVRSISEGDMRINELLKYSPFGRCRNFRTAFYITWDGVMLPCANLNYGSEHPFELGFSQAWQLMHARLAEIVLPKECRSCAALSNCPLCAGIREPETGELNGIPRQLCREYRELSVRDEKEEIERSVTK